MTDDELRTELQKRVAAVRQRMADACKRAGRADHEVTLVAVTKSASIRVAAMLPGLGCLDLAESRPQELWKKQAELPTIRWHFIGHLQRNKLDRTVPLVSLFHSVDSERLLQALQDFAKKSARKLPVLLEVNCSREAAKGGLTPESILPLGQRWSEFPDLELRGLMTMAAHHEDPQACRPTFAELRQIRDRLRTAPGFPLPDLSMGMSNDYEIAIEEGATLIRVGSTLFEGLEQE